MLLFTGLCAQQMQHNLMPAPASIEPGIGELIIKKNFSISLEGNYHPRLTHEASRFLRRLDQKTGSFFIQNKVTGKTHNAELIIIVTRPGKVKLHEDESYKLHITSSGIKLTATTDIGAIRGLETLLQLLNTNKRNYYFPGVSITDHPRFAWRGLMIDVARHYMPLNVIYRNIDAMAAVKLNILHLHLSDDQGFRFESKIFPKLTQQASDNKYYTQQELKNIVAYADQRGIRVMPEIDVPGHATSILVAYPELGSKDTTYTLERYAGVFDPTLDPTNEDVYTFMEKLFAEIATVFSDAFFHIGGDENMGKHWDANKAIQAFKKTHNLKNNHDLHAYFNVRVQKILAKIDKRTMGWEEIKSPKMPQTTIIHSWKGENEGTVAKKSLYESVKAGYETVLSNGYYLDLMQPTSQHYMIDPTKGLDLTEAEKKRVLGGEMCMWSELVVPETIDSRIWPRGAAIAERLWSPKNVNDIHDMYRRLNIISLQLEELGLTHYSNREVILRKLAKSRDTESLQTLIEVVEPMKGYTRNPRGRMYLSYSPFTLWADAATADAKVAREFNRNVERYLSGISNEKKLKEQLLTWKANHEKVLPIIERSPVLLEITELSANLSKIATVGLESLNYLETDVTPEIRWFKDSFKSLNAAHTNGGRTELQIITGIELLVKQVESQVNKP